MAIGATQQPVRAADRTARSPAGGSGHTAYLVEVMPGLLVVEDYYRPTFYAQRRYWTYCDSDACWMSSDSWLGPWESAGQDELPAVVRELETPWRFALFHAPGSATRRPVAESGA